MKSAKDLLNEKLTSLENEFLFCNSKHKDLEKQLEVLKNTSDLILLKDQFLFQIEKLKEQYQNLFEYTQMYQNRREIKFPVSFDFKYALHEIIKEAVKESKE